MTDQGSFNQSKRKTTPSNPPPKYPSRYIDDNDVERGYYVYTHACTSTARVFYVGRGFRGRAWSTRRSNAWIDYVATLPKGYSVQLIHQDLTEEEAIALERKEIVAHGGAAAVGGSLINWIPGEAGQGFGCVYATVGIDLYEGNEEGRRLSIAVRDAYEQARRFHPLSPAERQSAAQRLEEHLHTGIDTEAMHEFLSRSSELRLPEALCGIRTARDEINGLKWLANQLARKKLTYRNFCFDGESALESFAYIFDDPESYPLGHYHDLVSQIYNNVIKWFSQFDTGNRKEAEAFATAEEIRLVGGQEAFNLRRAKTIQTLLSNHSEALTEETIKYFTEQLRKTIPDAPTWAQATHPE